MPIGRSQELALMPLKTMVLCSCLLLLVGQDMALVKGAALEEEEEGAGADTRSLNNTVSVSRVFIGT